MQTTNESPVTTQLHKAWEKVVSKFEDAKATAREGLKGCLMAPFTFVWNVICILWDLSWAIFWLVTGTGCLLSAPVAVLIAAIYLGFGWVSIPVTLVALVVATPFAIVAWLIWVGFKRLVGWFFGLFVSDEAKQHKAEREASKSRTKAVLFWTLVIVSLCTPLIIVTVPVAIGYGIVRLVQTYGSRKQPSHD